jgi:peptidoglycan/LPS O-acetylase OafA/YrhL
MKTLAELDASKGNNFDAIRFVAATLVIYAHAYAVSGHANDERLAGLTGFIGFGSLAVEVFFLVSGYLITRSLMQRNNLIDFAEARVLRVFPALVVCCAISAFLLGVLVTTLSASEYLTHRQTWNYFLHNGSLLSVQWILPGVFETNILKSVVNGSLWTLPIEFKMYAVILALGVVSIAIKRYRGALLTLTIGGYLVFSFATQTAQLASHTSDRSAPLVAFFLIGALFYLTRKYVPVSTTLALALWGALLLARGTFLAVPLYYAALSYSLLAIAFDTTFQIHRFARHGDFSYGLYLYGFPVKQAIIFIAGSMSANRLFLIAFPITLLLAWLSWKFVEAPSLRRKGAISAYLKSRFSLHTPDAV